VARLIPQLATQFVAPAEIASISKMEVHARRMAETLAEKAWSVKWIQQNRGLVGMYFHPLRFDFRSSTLRRSLREKEKAH